MPSTHHVESGIGSGVSEPLINHSAVEQKKDAQMERRSPGSCWSLCPASE